MPPEASAGFSNGAIATVPSTSAITVRAPLRTTTERHAPAASRGGGDPRRVVRRDVAVVGVGVAAAGPQPGELAGMRRQDGRAPVAFPPAVHRRQRSKRLGVEHDRRGIGVARGRGSAGGRARPWPGPAGAPARPRSHRARGRGSGPGRARGRPPRRRPRAGPSSSPRRPSRRTAAGAIPGPPASRGPRRPGRRRGRRAAPRRHSRANRR